jgi:hypothetical protein
MLVVVVAVTVVVDEREELLAQAADEPSTTRTSATATACGTRVTKLILSQAGSRDPLATRLHLFAPVPGFWARNSPFFRKRARNV